MQPDGRKVTRALLCLEVRGERVCLRNDLLIFNDLNMSEEALIQVEVRENAASKVRGSQQHRSPPSDGGDGEFEPRDSVPEDEMHCLNSLPSMVSKATDHFRGESLMTDQSLDNRGNNNGAAGHPGANANTTYKYQSKASDRPTAMAGHQPGPVQQDSHFGRPRPGFREAEDERANIAGQDHADQYPYDQRQGHDASQRHMALPVEDDYSNLKNFLNQIRGKNQMLLSKDTYHPAQNWDKMAEQPENLQSQSMGKQKKFKSIHSR